MKRLYYVRHGETELNAIWHWAGHIETPLTSKGIAQAKKAGKKLSSKGLKIDLIISSPLSRAYDTAKHIATELGYPVNKIQKNGLFIERSFGDMEGTSWKKYMETMTLEDMDKVNGAETIKELGIRAAKALKYVKSLKEDNILIVSHGSFGRALRRVVNDMPHHMEYDDEHRAKLYVGNAEIVELI